MRDDNAFEPGTFVKVTRAWCVDLKEPCWTYMLSEQQIGGDFHNALILKGKFKDEQCFRKFHRTDMASEQLRLIGDNTYGCFDETGRHITTEIAVPPEEVPADVMAVFVEWSLLGEPGEVEE